MVFLHLSKWGPFRLDSLIKITFFVIVNAIWWFETSNTHKDFTPPSQGIWQWFLIKQRKAHTPQGRKWIEITRYVCYYQVVINFVAKSMVDINPSLIRWPKSRHKVIEKNIKLPHDWWWKALVRRKINDWKFFVATWKVTKNIKLP